MYLNRAMVAPWFMRNRQYNPTLGRFMQTDPIGIQGGVNLYGYVGNDPVNFRDPWGLVPQYVRWCRVTGRVLPDGSFEITATCWIEFVDPSGPGFIQTGPNSYEYVGGVSGGSGGSGGGGVSSSTENQQRCEQLLGASRLLGDVAHGFGLASTGLSAAGVVTALVPGGQPVAAGFGGAAKGAGIVSIQLQAASSVIYGVATGDWIGAGANFGYSAISNFTRLGNGSALSNSISGIGGGAAGEIVSFGNIQNATCPN